MYTLYLRTYSLKKKRITDQFQIITIRVSYTYVVHDTPGVRENWENR